MQYNGPQIGEKIFLVGDTYLRKMSSLACSYCKIDPKYNVWGHFSPYRGRFKLDFFGWLETAYNGLQIRDKNFFGWSVIFKRIGFFEKICILRLQGLHTLVQISQKVYESARMWNTQKHNNTCNITMWKTEHNRPTR